MNITIGQVMNDLKAGIEVPASTVDKLSFGQEHIVVKGIVTAFSASQSIIEQASALGANLIVSHEGVFYSHHDAGDWLRNDTVVEAKAAAIEKAGVGIFRFHEYMHLYQPDAIMIGLLRKLGWAAAEMQPAAAIVSIPAMQLGEVAEYLKSRLQIPYVRAAGEPTMLCKRVGVLVGYRGGGSSAIPLLQQENVDLILAGEGPEWETPEYIRDALHQGHSKALIMLGHAESEAPGMEYLAETLSEKYPELPIYFLADDPVFRVF
ncbi:Putative GTP cyclohydrolase 1 type 2, NIF3 family [Paenibacillus algorifonticola]|uniref:GTP cyclohydrolase 1 type 2 homolog n=1 Tax=Paenibacillus algorifonticola TaxID=684063 RepID=A0A1I1XYK0_9BACL|nr:Nif3-like dinuclear metal center hexameric protein [Paenibacillus algorifonticola]SFE12456.1 Putative GTP cyclohydrolase 1 type 2, NIF3 family [Paenibacillus algorifonticola]